MPIFPDRNNADRLRVLMDSPQANAYDAERREVNTALTFLAVSARLQFPTARFLVIDDGDQGPYGYLADITDDALNTVIPDGQYASDTADGYDSWLYDNHRDTVLPFLKDGQEEYLDRADRNPWRSVIIDIDKVLANPPELIPDQPSITIPDDAWQELGEADDTTAGDKRSRLHTSITINGTPFHLEAYEVTQDENGYQTTVQGDDEDVDHYAAATTSTGPFVTTAIQDRNYVLFATPHCD